MAVRVATADDLWEVARIHKARFSEPGYLLGQYSTTLIRAFYLAFLERAIMLVSTSPSGIDGFVLGGNADVLRACKRSFIRANALRGIFESILLPRLWFIGLQTVGDYVWPRRKPAAPEPPSEDMRMLSIAIADRPVRGGTAMSLILAFDERVRGLCTGYQGTVLKTNVQLLRFYDLVGLRPVGDNGEVVTVRKSLVPPGSSE